jgi:hypothetical protein
LHCQSNTLLLTLAAAAWFQWVPAAARKPIPAGAERLAAREAVFLASRISRRAIKENQRVESPRRITGPPADVGDFQSRRQSHATDANPKRDSRLAAGYFNR